MTDKRWAVLNDPKRISNQDYDYLMALFSNNSKYDFFIVSVDDFTEKIIDVWLNSHKFINFYEFVHRYEYNPKRYLYSDGRPRDKTNFLAFKIAQYLAFNRVQPHTGKT